MLKLGPEQDLAHTDCIIILNTCVPLKYLAEKMIMHWSLTNLYYIVELRRQLWKKLNRKQP